MRGHHFGRTLVLASAIIALLSTLPLSARLIPGGPPDLNYLVTSSSMICQAEVVSARTEFVDRRIITTYDLRVDETLKGQEASELTLTMMGGAVEDPLPVALVFDGMVVLSEGQDVVLFLHENPSVEALRASNVLPTGSLQGPVANSLQPVLGDYGVFTVLTDPATGDNHVTRLQYSGMGITVTPEVNQMVLNTTESHLATLSGPALGTADKMDLLERGLDLTEDVGQQEIMVWTADGVVPIPMAQPVQRPSAAMTAEPDRDDEDSTSLEMTSMRTLEDFRSEVLDLIEAEEE